ncbi:MAG: DUF1259 domain-containing protein [Thermoproteota archaeon]|nr:DUF1259 domain-containing protein [Thermoproteota archaeon]
MKSKKLPFLLPVGLALLLSTSILVVSISPTAFGQQQGTTGGQQQGTTGGQAGSTIDCQTAASTLGGLIIPNPTGTCDVAVPRQGLQVQDSATGASLNNLLVINPLFEFTPASNQATTGAANQAMVYGFAEFALREGELTSAMRMLSNSSWNVVAVHNHVIGESPSMIFAHAIANGDINTLTRDARMVLDGLMTQTQSQQGNQTTTTTGGMAGNTPTTGGGGGTTTGGDTNSSPSANSLTGGTTTGQGATAGGGVGTMGGGGGTSPDPGLGTTDGTGGGGQQQQQQQGGGETGTTTTNGTGGGGQASGGFTATPGGAAGPQVSP